MTSEAPPPRSSGPLMQTGVDRRSVDGRRHVARRDHRCRGAQTMHGSGRASCPAPGLGSTACCGRRFFTAASATWRRTLFRLWFSAASSCSPESSAPGSVVSGIVTVAGGLAVWLLARSAHPSRSQHLDLRIHRATSWLQGSLERSAMGVVVGIVVFLLYGGTLMFGVLPGQHRGVMGGSPLRCSGRCAGGVHRGGEARTRRRVTGPFGASPELSSADWFLGLWAAEVIPCFAVPNRSVL